MSPIRFPALATFIFAVLLGVAAESDAQVKKIRVDATKKSVDTKEKLEPGDIVEVSEISGTVTYNKGGRKWGPEGSGEKLSPTYHLYSNAAPGTLLAYVGDSKNHYQVRKSIFAEAKSAGNLFFAINDAKDHYGDNAGGFDVSYRVIKKAKICSLRVSPGQLDFAWVNKTGGPITVNWIDQEGKEVPSARKIEPGQVFDGKTWIGHIYRVRDAKKNQIGMITVEPTSSKVDIAK